MTRLALAMTGALALVALEGRADGLDGSRSPLGRIDTRDTVELQAGSDSIELSDSRYPYFGGELIAVRAGGTPVLRLDDASVALVHGSAVRVTGEPGFYRIALKEGTVRVRSGAATRFEINNVQIRADGHSVQKLEKRAPLDVVAAIDAEERLTVCSSGGHVVAMRAGEAPWSPSPCRPSSKKSFSGVARRGEAGLSRGDQIARGVGALALGGTAALVVEGVLDDDDDDAPVASPVN